MTKRQAEAVKRRVTLAFHLKPGSLEVKKHEECPGWGLYLPKRPKGGEDS